MKNPDGSITEERKKDINRNYIGLHEEDAARRIKEERSGSILSLKDYLKTAQFSEEDVMRKRVQAILERDGLLEKEETEKAA